MWLWVVLLLLVIFGILYTLNAKHLKWVEGVWLYQKKTGKHEITVRIDPENQVIVVTGISPFEDRQPFLVKGAYPFFYSVQLYPIASSVPRFRLDFVPYPTKRAGEFKAYYHLDLVDLQSPKETISMQRVSGLT